MCKTDATHLILGHRFLPNSYSHNVLTRDVNILNKCRIVQRRKSELVAAGHRVIVTVSRVKENGQIFLAGLSFVEIHPQYSSFPVTRTQEHCYDSVGNDHAQRVVLSTGRCQSAKSRSSYSIRYSILMPRRSISSRKASAGTSRSCKTAPRLHTAPVHIIWRTMDAGNAVVRIMALMSLLGS